MQQNGSYIMNEKVINPGYIYMHLIGPDEVYFLRFYAIVNPTERKFIYIYHFNDTFDIRQRNVYPAEYKRFFEYILCCVLALFTFVLHGMLWRSLCIFITLQRRHFIYLKVYIISFIWSCVTILQALYMIHILANLYTLMNSSGKWTWNIHIVVNWPYHPVIIYWATSWHL